MSETVDEMLKRLWAETLAKPVEPEPQPVLSASTLGAPGTQVRVIGTDPHFNRACAGHPALGSVGTIDERPSPEGKTTVAFRGDAFGKLMIDDGSWYEFEEDDDPIALYLPDNILEVVV